MNKPAHYQTLEYARMERLLRDFARNRAQPLQVLDFGCGRGKYLELVKSQGHVPTGADANPTYVAEGRAAGFKVFSPDELFASSDRYDIILLSHLVEHLEPNALVDLIPKLCRMLHPDGQLVVITPLLGERFFHDFSHIRPYYPQSIRHAFGQESAPLLFGGVSLVELTDIYFFKDPYRTRTWRSFYVHRAAVAPVTRLLNGAFDLLWRVSGGRIGVKSSWLGIYRVLNR